MRSLVDLVCVDPERVHAIWSQARDGIRSAIEKTGLSDFEDIERDVLKGNQLLWLAWNGEAIEAVATTHLVLVGGRKICVLTACAGQDRDRWLPLLAHIEGYAKNEGCEVMRIFGRRGWQRVLEGYHVENVVLEKELI